MKEFEKEQLEFMNEAIRLAHSNIKSGKGGPFGAVVVKDGKIIGKGSNSVTQNNDPTAHAEIVAIREACATLKSFQLNGCDIYSSCEPCPMCLGAILWSRPSRLYFAATREDAALAGFDDSYLYTQVPLPIDLRDLSTLRMQRNEAVKVFEEWIELDQKIPY
jgi:guanine deaminase